MTEQKPHGQATYGCIVVENISVRRKVKYFSPAGDHFRLEKEIKNIITVIAKTNHYWQEHAQSLGDATTWISHNQIPTDLSHPRSRPAWRTDS